MVSSDKDPLYRDLDKFSSSETPDEGEETNSILIVTAATSGRQPSTRTTLADAALHLVAAMRAC